MDALRNQIIERKVIDLVLEHAKFKDVPYKPEGADTEAIDQSAGGEDEEPTFPRPSIRAKPSRSAHRKEHDVSQVLGNRATARRSRFDRLRCDQPRKRT